MLYRLTSILLLSMGLVACAGVYQLPPPVQQQSREPESSQDPGQVPQVGPAVPTQPLPPTEPRRESVPLGPPAPEAPASPTSALQAAISEAMAAGELDRAAALCERALRITPRDAGLWLRLASIRQRQGRNDEARGLVQRALSLAAGNAQLELQGRALLELLDQDS